MSDNRNSAYLHLIWTKMKLDIDKKCGIDESITVFLKEYVVKQQNFIYTVNYDKFIDVQRDKDNLQSDPTYEEILQSIRRVTEQDNLNRHFRQPKVKIYRAPGWSLRHFAQFVFTKKHYERVFEPQLSDMEMEYREALQAGAIWKARWVVMRGYGMFWLAVCGHTVASLVKTIWKSVT